MICRVIPYEGHEPFLFISYCHANENIVYPLIERLASDGFRLWYDDGIHPGSDWPEIIARHLNDCHVCIEILTPEYTESHNCRNEVNFLVQQQKTIIPIVWTDFPMSLGLKLQLGGTQFIKAFEMPNLIALFQRLYQSEPILACRGWNPMYRNVQPEIKPEPSKKVVPVLDAFAKPIPDSKPVPSPEPIPEPKPALMPEPKPEPLPEVKPAPKPDPIPEVKPAPKPDPIPEPKPAPKPEPIPEPKPTSKPDLIPEPEPALMPEPLPEVKPAPKPDPIPEPIPAPESTPEPEPVQEAIPVSGSVDEYNDDEMTVREEPDEEKTVYMPKKRKPDPIKLPLAGLLRLSTGQLYLFRGEKTTFGRSSKVNVQLADESHSISNRHFEIRFTQNDGWMIVDTDSANGTSLNGVPLEGLQPTSLPNQSQLLVAYETFLFVTEPDIESLRSQAKIAQLYCREMNELTCVWNSPFVIGRSNSWPRGTLSDHRASRIHGYLELVQNDYSLRVSGKQTANGTYLNDNLLSPGSVVTLKDQDIIRIGSVYHITFYHLDITLEDKTK